MWSVGSWNFHKKNVGSVASSQQGQWFAKIGVLIVESLVGDVPLDTVFVDTKCNIIFATMRTICQIESNSDSKIGCTNEKELVPKVRDDREHQGDCKESIAAITKAIPEISMIVKAQFRVCQSKKSLSDLLKRRLLKLACDIHNMVLKRNLKNSSQIVRCFASVANELGMNRHHSLVTRCPKHIVNKTMLSVPFCCISDIVFQF